MRSGTPTQAKLIISLLLGNILEWYGFSIFIEFSGQHLQQFLPQDYPTTNSLLISFIFASGFLLRPVGGFFYAHFGDRYGRLGTLLLSILLMLIPTTIIGLLPSYQTIGILAPLLLIILRLLQGLSAGGELPGTFIFAVEYIESTWRGLYGSIPALGAIAGMLAASIVHTLLQLTDSTNWPWLWRLPFLLSALLGLLGYYFLRQMSENHVFLIIKNSMQTSNAPLTESLKNPKRMFLATAICAISASTIYQMFIYMTESLTRISGFSVQQASWLTDYSLLLLILFIPLCGYFSDRLGRKIVMIAGTIGLILIAYPSYFILEQGSLPYLLVIQIFLAFLCACVFAPLPAYLAELFPTRLRYSSVAFAYNMAFVIFGGIVPFLGVIYHVPTNAITLPTLSLMVAGSISLLALCALPETYQQPTLNH